MLRFGYKQSHADHTLFTKKFIGKIVVLIVYVDDIIMTGNDVDEILNLKSSLAQEFEIKDLGSLRYFLGMEVARSDRGFLSPNGSIYLIYWKKQVCWVVDLQILLLR
jgi:hypothetical protein